MMCEQTSDQVPVRHTSNHRSGRPESDLERWFSRVVVINLKRRPERLQAFRQRLIEGDWPFKEPVVFNAIDGGKVPVPHHWNVGGGAWGCMQSHRQVLEQALLDGVRSILVMEDDACIRPGFDKSVAEFLRIVPRDWDQLMLGGQLFGDSKVERVAPGLLKVTQCERTHCYALRGRAIQDLYQHWHDQTTGHCDWHMGDWQERGYSIYAPEPFLVGQGPGRSDISGANNPCKFWIPPSSDAPVILLQTPQNVIAELRARYGFHTGFCRDPESDIDYGLVALFSEPDSDEGRTVRLRQWVEMIQWEAASMPAAVCAIWHPECTAELVARAIGRAPTVIQATTVQQALAAWRPPAL